MFLNWTSGVSGSSGPEGTAFRASAYEAVAAVAIASGGHHPSLLLCFCRCSSLVPIHIFLLSDCWLVVLQVWILSLWGILGLVAMAVFLLLSML